MLLVFFILSNVLLNLSYKCFIEFFFCLVLEIKLFWIFDRVDFFVLFKDLLS